MNEEVTGDLLTPVILESKFEGYLSKRHNWICWERKDYWEIHSLDEGASVRGSHMNNNRKCSCPVGRERERCFLISAESNIKDTENKNDQCLIKSPMCSIWWLGGGCKKNCTQSKFYRGSYSQSFIYQLFTQIRIKHQISLHFKCYFVNCKCFPAEVGKKTTQYSRLILQNLQHWITHVKGCFGQSALWDSIAFRSNRPLCVWTRTGK